MMETVIIAGASVVSLAVGLAVFTHVNKRLLSTFTDQHTAANEKAEMERQKLLDAFLEAQRSRDAVVREEHSRTLAEIREETKLAMESASAAQAFYNGRLRTVEEERFPRLEQRMRDVEGRLDRLEHPSLRPR